MTNNIHSNPKILKLVNKIIKFILYKANIQKISYIFLNQQQIIENKTLNYHIQYFDKHGILNINITKYVQEYFTENYKMSFRTTYEEINIWANMSI